MNAILGDLLARTIVAAVLAVGFLFAAAGNEAWPILRAVGKAACIALFVTAALMALVLRVEGI